MDTNVQNNIPKAVWLTLGLLAVVFLALAVIDKAHNLTLSFHARPENTISMSAEGKTSATPDLATLTVGVTSQAATAQAATSDMAKKVNQITETIKSLGVDAKDITTSNYSVYPMQDYSNGRNTITGYQGTETVTVKIHGVDKSTDKVSKVLDSAVVNGSNQIQGVYFSFEDPDSRKQDARKQAIAKAKQKAQELANEAGLKLGKVVSINDSDSPIYSPMPYAMDSAKGMGGSSSVAPNVEAGTQDIVVNVTMVFEIK